MRTFIVPFSPVVHVLITHLLNEDLYVSSAARPNTVRSALISRIFRQGPHSGPYKSGPGGSGLAFEIPVLGLRRCLDRDLEDETSATQPPSGRGRYLSGAPLGEKIEQLPAPRFW